MCVNLKGMYTKQRYIIFKSTFLKGNKITKGGPCMDRCDDVAGNKEKALLNPLPLRS